MGPVLDVEEIDREPKPRKSFPPQFRTQLNKYEERPSPICLQQEDGEEFQI